MRAPREAARRIALRWLTPALVLVGVAAAASPQLTTYFPKGFDDFKYQRTVFEKVLKGWSLAGVKTLPVVGKKAVVIVTIDRTGKLRSMVLSGRSGSKEWDDAALAALKKAGTFPPLPAVWAHPQAEAHFHFQYLP